MAHVGIVDFYSVSLVMAKAHYTNAGIRQTARQRQYPERTDDPGNRLLRSFSGRDTDKSALFVNFAGELETAPMIRQCPLDMESRLLQTSIFHSMTSLSGDHRSVL